MTAAKQPEIATGVRYLHLLDLLIMLAGSDWNIEHMRPSFVATLKMNFFGGTYLIC